MEDRPILQQFARKEVSVLKTTLTQWKNHHHHHHHSANARLTKDQLELKPCTVHQQLCKAQWTCRRLQECLETLDVPVEQMSRMGAADKYSAASCGGEIAVGRDVGTIFEA